MSPAATVKLTVAAWASVCPPAPSMPPVPAGTVTVSVLEGTKGAEATKAMVVGVHLLPRPGDRRGERRHGGVGRQRGRVPDRHGCVARDADRRRRPGDTETTSSGGLDAAGCAVGVVVGLADTLRPGAAHDGDAGHDGPRRHADAGDEQTAAGASRRRCCARRREWECAPDIAIGRESTRRTRPFRHHRAPSVPGGSARSPGVRPAELRTLAWTARSRAAICDASVSFRPSGPRT